MPVSHQISRWERLSESRAGTRLARALLPYEQVRLTLVRDHLHGVHQLTKSADGHATVRLSPRGTHTAVVLVDKLDRATLRAIRYARTLGANDVFAVHAALDPANAAVLADVWMSLHVPIPLALSGVLGSQRRPLTRTRRSCSCPKDGTEVTVVMPRRDYSTRRQRLLHDRTSRRVAKTLGNATRTWTSRPVPYYVAPSPREAAGDAGHGRCRVGSAADARNHHGLWPWRALRASVNLVEGGNDVTGASARRRRRSSGTPGEKAGST